MLSVLERRCLTETIQVFYCIISHTPCQDSWVGYIPVANSKTKLKIGWFQSDQANLIDHSLACKEITYFSSLRAGVESTDLSYFSDIQVNHIMDDTSFLYNFD